MFNFVRRVKKNLSVHLSRWVYMQYLYPVKAKERPMAGNVVRRKSKIGPRGRLTVVKLRLNRPVVSGRA